MLPNKTQYNPGLINNISPKDFPMYGWARNPVTRLARKNATGKKIRKAPDIHAGNSSDWGDICAWYCIAKQDAAIYMMSIKKMPAITEAIRIAALSITVFYLNCRNMYSLVILCG